MIKNESNKRNYQDINNCKLIQNKKKYLFYPTDEVSTWFLHMHYFLKKVFGVQDFIYGKKYYNGNIIKKIFSAAIQNIKVLKSLNQIEPKSEMIFLHPLPNGLLYKYIFKKLKNKGVILIGYVCDIALLRLSDNDSKNNICVLLAENTDKCLLYYDYIIIPTEKEKKYLLDKGINEKKIVIIRTYDYYIETNLEEKDCEDREAAIAGGLFPHKAEYVYQLDEISSLKFNLYGNGYLNDRVMKNVEYKGFYNGTELTDIVNEKWGLVWDGNNLECLSGRLGEYLKYNSPHKMSFYIASGIPVIISKEAAMSQYIYEKKLGIVIENLRDLPDALNSISDEEYCIIYHNVQLEAKLLRKGTYLKECLDNIDRLIRNSAINIG